MHFHTNNYRHMTCCILQASKIAQSLPDPFPRQRVGSGYEPVDSDSSSSFPYLTGQILVTKSGEILAYFIILVASLPEWHHSASYIQGPTRNVEKLIGNGSYM